MPNNDCVSKRHAGRHERELMKTWRKTVENSRQWQLYLFTKKRLTLKGKRQKGEAIEVLAPSKEAAVAAVGFESSKRLKDVEVKNKAINPIDRMLRQSTTRKTPKAAEIVTFVNDMARALRAGIKFTDAIQACAATATTPVFRGVLGSLYIKLAKDGMRVADAMEQFPFAFNAELIAVIRASEESGNSAAIYTLLSKRLSKQHRILNRISVSAIYSGVMTALVFAMAIFLGAFAIPSMIEGYQIEAHELPRYLYMPISVLMFFTRSPIGVTLAVVAFLLPFVYWRKILFSMAVQRLLLSVPRLGEFVRKFLFVKSFSIFSILLKAGVPQKTLFELSGSSSGSVVFKKFFQDVAGRVVSGEAIPDAFLAEKDAIGKDGNLFAQRLILAHEAANVSELVDEVVESTSEELDTLSEQVPKWLDTLVTGLLTTVVGTLAAILVLTNFTLNFMLTQ